MKVILFSMYYCKLRLGTMLGIYKTCNPLGVGWRWRRWEAKYHRRRGR